MFAGAISDAFQGSGQELFNASVLGIAVLMLMCTTPGWPRHGREIADEMRRVGTAVSEGAKPLTALAVVVGLAVLREGSEVVLFLYGILASGTTVSATLLGGVLGIVAGAAFTALTYSGCWRFRAATSSP
jgi:high-affinity iron transporter